MKDFINDYITNEVLKNKFNQILNENIINQSYDNNEISKLINDIILEIENKTSNDNDKLNILLKIIFKKDKNIYLLKDNINVNNKNFFILLLNITNKIKSYITNNKEYDNDLENYIICQIFNIDKPNYFINIIKICMVVQNEKFKVNKNNDLFEFLMNIFFYINNLDKLGNIINTYSNNLMINLYQNIFYEVNLNIKFVEDNKKLLYDNFNNNINEVKKIFNKDIIKKNYNRFLNTKRNEFNYKNILIDSIDINMFEKNKNNILFFSPNFLYYIGLIKLFNISFFQIFNYDNTYIEKFGKELIKIINIINTNNNNNSQNFSFEKSEKFVSLFAKLNKAKIKNKKTNKKYNSNNNENSNDNITLINYKINEDDNEKEIELEDLDVNSFNFSSSNSHSLSNNNLLSGDDIETILYKTIINKKINNKQFIEFENIVFYENFFLLNYDDENNKLIFKIVCLRKLKKITLI